ncbi:MAG: hypothetical protein AB8B79_08440 [Granulosicoccus sp.]
MMNTTTHSFSSRSALLCWQVSTRLIRQCVLALLVVLSVSSCSTLTSTPQVSASSEAPWALLPINNLSQTAQADSQAQTFVETHLRARGVQRVDIYRPLKPVSLRGLLDVGAEIDDATQWAQSKGYRYAVTGTVHEWQYKGGTDKEPAVGVSLKLIDLSSNRVLWQANAARTGWGYANLPAVANKVVSDLLQQIQLDAVVR